MILIHKKTANLYLLYDYTFDNNYIRIFNGSIWCLNFKDMGSFEILGWL